MNLGDGSHPRLYILSSNHNVRVTEICIFTNKQLNLLVQPRVHYVNVFVWMQNFSYFGNYEGT